MRRAGRQTKLPEEQIMQFIINGLKNDIRATVILTKPTPFDVIGQKAVLAEAAQKPSTTTKSYAMLIAVADLKAQINIKITSLAHVNATQNASGHQAYTRNHDLRRQSQCPGYNNNPNCGPHYSEPRSTLLQRQKPRAMPA